MAKKDKKIDPELQKIIDKIRSLSREEFERVEPMLSEIIKSSKTQNKGVRYG